MALLPRTWRIGHVAAVSSMHSMRMHRILSGAQSATVLSSMSRPITSRTALSAHLGSARSVGRASTPAANVRRPTVSQAKTRLPCCHCSMCRGYTHHVWLQISTHVVCVDSQSTRRRDLPAATLCQGAPVTAATAACAQACRRRIRSGCWLSGPRVRPRDSSPGHQQLLRPLNGVLYFVF